MKKHIFIKKSIMEASAEELFVWHSAKGALERLNPPWSFVKVLYEKGSINNGAKKRLKVKAGFLNYIWEAVHSDYKENRFFRDTQIKGPFAYWSHYHNFITEASRQSILEDIIEYSLPFSFAGDIFLERFIKKELKKMFVYRHTITARDIKTHRLYKDKKKMNILISGASGLLGSALIPFLTAAGHKVIKLVRKKPKDTDEVYWNPTEQKANIDKIGEIDAVINLSGENIGEGRWTNEKRDNIIFSRLNSTKLLCRIMEAIKLAPKVFLSASAIGYYGNTGNVEIDEKALSGKNFISKVCKIWEEAAADISKKIPIRTVFMRIGVVITPAGGALKKMLFPFKLGAGFKIGDGSQYISWIGIEDLIAAIYYLLQNDLIEGAVNITSPNPVTNYNFSQIISNVLSKPALFTIPSSVIKAFFQDMGQEILLEGSKVMPNKLISSGYNFIHTKLEDALKESLGLYK